ESHLHAIADVLGIGLDVDQIGAHLGAVAVDDGSDEWGRNAGCGKSDDGEGPHGAFARHRDRPEFRRKTTGAGVTPIEKSGAAVFAFLRDEVRIAVVEHQIVDQGDLARHNTSVVSSVDRSQFGSTTDAEYQDQL